MLKGDQVFCFLNLVVLTFLEIFDTSELTHSQNVFECLR